MRTHRLNDAPKLNLADVREKYRLWNAGEQIHSGVVAIGRLALSPGEIWTFRHDAGMFADFQDVLSTAKPLSRQFTEARTALRGLVQEDLALADISNPTLKEGVHGGYFRQRTDVEPWHIGINPQQPMPPQPKVVYSVVLGAAPTRGLEGSLSREDIIWEEGSKFGHFKPGVPIGPTERLRAVEFEPGTVLRYTPLDGHASGNILPTDVTESIADPTINGPRLALQARTVLPVA